MANIPLSFETLEVREFPVYPAGRYTLKIVESRQETSKKGEPKLTLSFEILDGPDGQTTHAHKRLINSISLQPRSEVLWRFKRFVTACGLEWKSPMDDQAFVGIILSADIIINQWEGRDTNRVQNEQPWPPKTQPQAVGQVPQMFGGQPQPQQFAGQPQQPGYPYPQQPGYPQQAYPQQAYAAPVPQDGRQQFQVPPGYAPAGPPSQHR